MEDIFFDIFFEDSLMVPVDINIDFDLDGIFDSYEGGFLDLDHNFTPDGNMKFMDYDQDGLLNQYDGINDLDHDFTNDNIDSFIDINGNYIDDYEDPFQDWDEDGLFDGGYFQYRKMLKDTFLGLGDSEYV